MDKPQLKCKYCSNSDMSMIEILHNYMDKVFDILCNVCGKESTHDTTIR